MSTTENWKCSCGYDHVNRQDVQTHYDVHAVEEDMRRHNKSMSTRIFGTSKKVGSHHEKETFACEDCKKIIGCTNCQEEKSYHKKKQHPVLWHCAGIGRSSNGHSTTNERSSNHDICVDCLRRWNWNKR